jgi:hypothetical protein
VRGRRAWEMRARHIFCCIDQYRQPDMGVLTIHAPPKGGSIMNVLRETDRMAQPYTPTPDGFERRLRAWVRLPADGVPAPEAGEVGAPRKEPSAQDQA